MAGFELTPGLSSASSCPEAIWQSAKWWTYYYESAAKERERAIDRLTEAEGGAEVASAGTAERLAAALPMIPTGFFIVRQRAASVVENASQAMRVGMLTQKKDKSNLGSKTRPRQAKGGQPR
jgi:hypothetical protein